MAELTYVLVPGAGGDAWYWHRVVDELDARGVASLSVDLPADDPDSGLHEYVDAIVEATGEAGDVVLVGQSLGGFSSSLAVPRLPTAGLVLLNAMIPAPGETAAEWWSATGQPAAMREQEVAAGRDPDAGFDNATHFFHDLPPEVVADLEQRRNDETETIFEAAWDLEQWPDVLTWVIAGRDDRLFPFEFQRRVARERLGLEVVEVPGGHLAALSHPVEVAAAILAAPHV